MSVIAQLKASGKEIYFGPYASTSNLKGYPLGTANGIRHDLEVGCTIKFGNFHFLDYIHSDASRYETYFPIDIEHGISESIPVTKAYIFDSKKDPAYIPIVLSADEMPNSSADLILTSLRANYTNTSKLYLYKDAAGNDLHITNFTWFFSRESTFATKFVNQGPAYSRYSQMTIKHEQRTPFDPRGTGSQQEQGIGFGRRTLKTYCELKSGNDLLQVFNNASYNLELDFGLVFFMDDPVTFCTFIVSNAHDSYSGTTDNRTYPEIELPFTFDRNTAKMGLLANVIDPIKNIYTDEVDREGSGMVHFLNPYTKKILGSDISKRDTALRPGGEYGFGSSIYQPITPHSQSCENRIQQYKSLSNRTIGKITITISGIPEVTQTYYGLTSQRVYNDNSHMDSSGFGEPRSYSAAATEAYWEDLEEYWPIKDTNDNNDYRNLVPYIAQFVPGNKPTIWEEVGFTNYYDYSINSIQHPNTMNEASHHWWGIPDYEVYDEPIGYHLRNDFSWLNGEYTLHYAGNNTWSLPRDQWQSAMPPPSFYGPAKSIPDEINNYLAESPVSFWHHRYDPDHSEPNNDLNLTLANDFDTDSTLTTENFKNMFVALVQGPQGWYYAPESAQRWGRNEVGALNIQCTITPERIKNSGDNLKGNISCRITLDAPYYWGARNLYEFKRHDYYEDGVRVGIKDKQLFDGAIRVDNENGQRVFVTDGTVPYVDMNMEEGAPPLIQAGYNEHRQPGPDVLYKPSEPEVLVACHNTYDTTNSGFSFTNIDHTWKLNGRKGTTGVNGADGTASDYPHIRIKNEELQNGLVEFDHMRPGLLEAFGGECVYSGGTRDSVAAPQHNFGTIRMQASPYS